MKLINKFLLVFIEIYLIQFPIVAQFLSIEEATESLVKNYPEAHLSDIYKSFYQDEFGPGHLLTDTLVARNYFNEELSDTSIWKGPKWEYTGQGKNFVRLNMGLIKNGIIPADEYFEAFLNSLQKAIPPLPEEWINQWKKVANIIDNHNYHFENEDQDRSIIEDKLKTHQFTIHHSPRFNEIYNFHYRIISIPEFEKLKSKYRF